MDEEIKSLIKFTIENDALMGIRNGNKVVVYNADSLADTIMQIVKLRSHKHPEKILGMDVVVDPTLPPDHWELRTQNPND